MSDVDLVTVGWLTTDDIVLPDGTYERGVLGGGALYSAVGAGLWTARVGLHAVTGEKHFESARAEIGARGLDTTGISAIEGSGLELWLLHESDTDKQQVPKLSCATAEDMDEGRAALPEEYYAARGFHIAPQTPQGSFGNLERLNDLPSRSLLTLDLLSDVYVDVKQYEDLNFLNRLTAFLPSQEEVNRIWKPRDLRAWMCETVQAYGCHLVVKQGHRGSLLCEAPGARLLHVPAYPARVLDTTGAGDAYCGGFLAGLVAGQPLQECAAMGTVSASFVVEVRGALATARPSHEVRQERLETVLEGVVEDET